jgi:hypothetical protein
MTLSFTLSSSKPSVDLSEHLPGRVTRVKVTFDRVITLSTFVLRANGAPVMEVAQSVDAEMDLAFVANDSLSLSLKPWGKELGNVSVDVELTFAP